MKKYIINGGKNLSGKVTISGSKNVVTKAIVAASLTSEEVVIHNIPLISDLTVALDVAKSLGADIAITNHTLKIQFAEIKNIQIPLEAGAKSRTSSMFLAPLLCRAGHAKVPNPGGCRLGARPIDRHIEGLTKMGAHITYDHGDGYFHAEADGLTGTSYTFEKNTHTGTETLVIAGVLASGTTILENAAQEPEVDDLIHLLNSMGAKIHREERTITIEGVQKLHGTSYTIMPDRNEAVTFAIVSSLTGGNITLHNIDLSHMKAFLDEFKKAGGSWEETRDGIRFYIEDKVKPVDITTRPHPGFMTDWQGPWSVLMTQAEGDSVIHETIYENRFSYVNELIKMGAKLEFFNPHVEDPREFYNFNFDPKNKDHYNQGLRINGKTKLHNAVLNIADLRAGATLVIAALIARGASVIYGIEHINRGYEAFEERLAALGAHITLKHE